MSIVEEFSGKFTYTTFNELNPSANEPFAAPRQASRLLFDFGAMASLLQDDLIQLPILDFGAGSGWLSELLVRMGIPTVSFDIHNNLVGCIDLRVNHDSRLNPQKWKYKQGDGHRMPFSNATFGHVVCYDSLHHMHSYDVVLSEIYRVLVPEGRAIFVEPGARHSSSPETINFLEAQKKNDPTWIERDVVLDEIEEISKNIGFSKGLEIAPLPHPSQPLTFSFQDWEKFRSGKDLTQRMGYSENLSRINYDERVIFFLQKPVL